MMLSYYRYEFLKKSLLFTVLIRSCVCRNVEIKKTESLNVEPAMDLMRAKNTLSLL